MINDCKELHTLNYKNIIETGKPIVENTTIDSEDILNDFLNNDINNNKQAMWSKLTKTTKTQKIKKYIKTNVKNLSDEELNTSCKSIFNILERKKMTRNNDICYNMDTGNIEKIPDIVYDSKLKIFKMIQSDKSDKSVTYKKKKDSKID